MDFHIDDNNIPKSFDNLARQLLLEHVISVNQTDIEMTEIEFYYFKEGIHEDNYTHPHKRPPGHWRLHKQGIDITFEGTVDQDGGILIRGIKYEDRYINGPLKTLAYFMESMQNVFHQNHLCLRAKSLTETNIIKTHRHLPNKIQYKDFHLKKYRYLKSLEKLDLTRQSKEGIQANSLII